MDPNPRQVQFRTEFLGESLKVSIECLERVGIQFLGEDLSDTSFDFGSFPLFVLVVFRVFRESQYSLIDFGLIH